MSQPLVLINRLISCSKPVQFQPSRALEMAWLLKKGSDAMWWNPQRRPDKRWLNAAFQQ